MHHFNPIFTQKNKKKQIQTSCFLFYACNMLSDAQIIKFQMLYKEQFGKEISREEALEKGIKLMRLVQIVYKPITQEEYDAVQKDRRETLQKDSKKFKDNKFVYKSSRNL